MGRLARAYGAGPVHLAGVVVGLALAVYGVARIFQHSHVEQVVLWFVLVIVAHDLVLLPLYTLLARGALRVVGVRRPALLPHVVAPALISLLLFIVWFPLIVGKGRLTSLSTLPLDGYLSRWLILSAGLFVGSGLLYGLRAAREHRRAGGPRAPDTARQI